MKKLLYVCLFLLFTPFVSAKEVITYNLYYFMSNIRCSSCHDLEAYTKEIFTELNNKDVIFKIINIDKKENKHFIKKYNIYTKSVVIAKLKDGKEVEYKNFDKIWNYLNNKEKFQNYLREEISNFMIKE